MISPATQLEDLLRRAAAPGPHPPATDYQRAGLTVERAALLEAVEALLPAVLADARAEAERWRHEAGGRCCSCARCLSFDERATADALGAATAVPRRDP